MPRLIPGGGGAGVALSADVSASVAQAIPQMAGRDITICNDGSVCLWFKLGDATVQADLASTPVLPGQKEDFTVFRDGGVYDHISVITRAGTTTATVSFGVET